MEAPPAQRDNPFRRRRSACKVVGKGSLTVGFIEDLWSTINKRTFSKSSVSCGSINNVTTNTPSTNMNTEVSYLLFNKCQIKQILGIDLKR